MAKDIEIKGLKELQQMFESLPKQVNQKAIWQRFWRLNSKPFIQAAKNNVPQKEGRLKRSIGYFTTRASRKFHGGYVGPRVKGAFGSKKGKSGYYGAFVEYGGEVMFWGKGPAKKGNQEFMQSSWREEKQNVLRNAIRDGEVIMAKAIKTHEARLKKYGKLGYK